MNLIKHKLRHRTIHTPWNSKILTIHASLMQNKHNKTNISENIDKKGAALSDKKKKRPVP